MAAVAQGQTESIDEGQAMDDNPNAPGDLDSYLLAAAAASVHAQQQHAGDDQQKAHSEDSFDSSATPNPNSVGTNGTSVNGSDTDDTRTAIQDQCHKYIDHLSPFPLPIGKRTPGGSAQHCAGPDGTRTAPQDFSQLPFTEATVELGKTRCYWALLSADHSQGKGPTGERLQFVYLDPVLQQHMAEQSSLMVGSDFYDYVHPEERDRVCDDMQKIVESRTLFGSVTRCRYSRVPHIRELLGAVDPPRDPEADRYVEDDSFVAIDIIINWIGDGMLLCFFHAIIDKAAEDNDEHHKSEWTNWCGIPGGTFTLRQCDSLWKQVKATPRETIPDAGPDHVFQVLEAGGDNRVLLSWPPPRLFLRDVEPSLVSQSETTAFKDGSYFADDFARLAQGVSIAPASSSLSDANTSCTRRFRAKHTLTTEGKIRNIESVLIPYGGVILACFQTTSQQPLPTPDAKHVLQAQTSPQNQPERRKAEDDASTESPNKRQRTELDIQSNELTAYVTNGIKPQTAASIAVSTLPAANAAAPASTPQTQERVAPSNGHTVKPANGHAHKPSISKYHKPAIKSESGGISALGSLMYTNAPAKPPATPVANRPADRKTSTPASKAANGRSHHNASPSPATAAALAAAGDSPDSPNKACTGCGKINSPEWRRGPSGHKTLCNACGLRYARSLSRKKKKKGKDGEVEFIEPTGDPSIVPKSRGGGGGSLPGVHRKNSKKRKEEEAIKAAASAGGAATNGALAPVAVRAMSTSSSSSASSTQNPAATATPAAKSVSPVKAEAPDAVKVESASAPTVADVSSTAAAGADSKQADADAEPTESTDPAHSLAVSIALDAIAQASSTAPLIDSDSLSLPVSNAISRAIAATIGSTDANPESQALPTAIGETDELDPAVSAAALQTIESVVSEALYKQLVHSSLPETPPADAVKSDDGGLDLSSALTADAIRAAAQAAVAHGVAEE
uniref:GATA-type domain-containing protein n=2 Tax=Kalmanozyma brasiliensis (strain GHG001) TaxID=1365824 RepID=V5F1C3_KALBG